MKLLKTKLWSPLDLIWFKTAAVTFGLLCGAFFSEVLMEYIWVVAAVFFATYTKTVHFYYFSKKGEQ
jgi:hypothetical protein|tara:strand:+ start:1468 stop:1668 length:201 start_codon:yes stop_codon:yes gene_type:complete